MASAGNLADPFTGRDENRRCGFGKPALAIQANLTKRIMRQPDPAISIPVERERF